jgi:DNA-binding MarR family transcriptional regulator
MDERERAIAEFQRAGRESSRLSVLFRHAIAGRLGLTVTDMECLDFLMDTGSATAGRLAEQTNLTTGAVTSLIRRLEQAGYVTSRRDPADRRRVVVTINPARIAEGVQLYESFGAETGRVIAGYSTEELLFLARHYDRMSTVFTGQLEQLRDGVTRG